MSQITDIKEIISKDHLAADIKLSTFISAASSFKQDSLLTPFPKSYLRSDGIKDFEKLVDDLKKIPSVEELVVLIMSGNVLSVLSDSTIDLIHWILTSPKFKVESVSRDKFDFVLALPKNSKKSSRPKHIFKIVYEDSGLETKFQHIKNNSGIDTKFAYHGTRFYNIYPILNYGLQQHKCQTGLFGEGLYFAQELDVSLLFSPSVLGWNLSQCGNTVSCVAVCEYINDPLYVKVRKENAKNSDIPQDYLLITNNELVRVRYLLVYGSFQKSLFKKPSAAKVENPEVIPERLTFVSWCRKNPLIISACLYILMLFLVGLNDHRAVQYYKNNVMRFLKNRFKFL